MRHAARSAAAAVSALLVAGVLGVVLLGVARRYLLGAPLGWTDELASVLFIWLVFWTAALAVPLREHVSFDLLTDALPARARRWIGAATSMANAIGTRSDASTTNSATRIRNGADIGAPRRSATSSRRSAISASPPTRS